MRLLRNVGGYFLLRKKCFTRMRRDACKEVVAAQPHLAPESVKADSYKNTQERSAGVRRKKEQHEDKRKIIRQQSTYFI